MDKLNLKNDRWILFILLPVIFLLCFFVWQLKADQSVEIVVRSDTPVWDLRDVDMDSHHVKLRGNTSEYVPEAFLTPEEFENRTDIQIGSPADAAQYYTARTRVLVPDGKLYAITFNSVDYADSIYMNGNHMQTVGRPGDSAQTVIPQTAMVYFTVWPEDGVIEVVHQASNFVHKEGGNPADLNIGSVETVGQYYDRQTLVTAIIMGACLLLCIVHLVLFALIKSYRANLYFALFCLVWLLRTGVVGVKAITILFPHISWYVTFRIEYMAIPIAALLIPLALDAMFSGLLQIWAKRIILAWSAAAALLFLFAPTILMTQALPFVYATTLLAAVYVIARFITGLLAQRSVRQIIILCGLIVFVYVALREMLYHSNVVIFPVAFTGMMDFAALVFILFQMVAAFHGTMQEVTAAKETEQRLAVENALLDRMNRMKSEFLGNVSHEMRTPLTVMSGYAQLTRWQIEENVVDEKTLDNLKAVSREAERLALLVEQLLDVAAEKENILIFDKIRLESIVERIAPLAAPILDKHGNRMVVNLADGLPMVRANANMILQVLINLITNANKHTRGGTIEINGQLTMDNGQFADGQIKRNDCQFITVCVIDTGEGIAPELLPHVFERHASGNSRSGLGLALCKEMIESHGGVITVESELAAGTTVRFTLPVVMEETP